MKFLEFSFALWHACSCFEMVPEEVRKPRGVEMVYNCWFAAWAIAVDTFAGLISYWEMKFSNNFHGRICAMFLAYGSHAFFSTLCPS